MRSDYMKSENYGKLFAFMTYENTLVTRVSLETGLRVGDVLKLRPGDLRGRTIRYIADKTGKAGRAVISRDLAERLRAVSGAEYIFPSRTDPCKHRSRSAVWRDVKRGAAALRAAGLIGDENITPHSARKTFAVNDAEKFGILHTQKALQHKSKETTKLYVFSEKYLNDMTDNFVLKALIREVAALAESVQKLEIVVENLK